MAHVLGIDVSHCFEQCLDSILLAVSDSSMQGSHSLRIILIKYLSVNPRRPKKGPDSYMHCQVKIQPVDCTLSENRTWLDQQACQYAKKTSLNLAVSAPTHLGVFVMGNWGIFG